MIGIISLFVLMLLIIMGWYDINRFEILTDKVIMEYPNFGIHYNGIHGPESKPLK